MPNIELLRFDRETVDVKIVRGFHQEYVRFQTLDHHRQRQERTKYGGTVPERVKWKGTRVHYHGSKVRTPGRPLT